MGIHDGHRQRMKKRFLDHGLDNFDDVNALELLLFYALPRQDTNALAHALLERFGSLSGVLEASAAELGSVPGVGESAAVPIVEARRQSPFLSIEDLQKRGHVGASVLEQLRAQGTLSGLADTNQLSMF